MDRQLLYLIGAALVLGILYLGLRYLLPLVLPFAFGAFLALMLEPVVNLLQVRARIPRPLATGITIISAVAVTVLVVVLLSASVAVDVKEITYRLPVYSNSMIKMLQEWAAQTEAFYGHLPGPLLQAVEEGVLRLYGLAGNMLGKLLGSLGALPNLILNLVLSFIAAYFVSKDRDRLGDFVRRTLPPKGAQHFQTLIRCKGQSGRAGLGSTDTGYNNHTGSYGRVVVAGDSPSNIYWAYQRFAGYYSCFGSRLSLHSLGRVSFGRG